MNKISEKTISRLCLYYRILSECKKECISSEELSKLTGFKASQIRKDLSYLNYNLVIFRIKARVIIKPTKVIDPSMILLASGSSTSLARVSPTL